MNSGFYDSTMKKTHSLFPVLFASMTCIGIPIKLEARTWPATGPLTQLTPPVSLVAHPIEGEGKERKAKLVVTNESDKEISRIVLTQFYLKQDGSVGSSNPNNIGFSIGKGESHTIKVSSFFMKDDTASVDGVVTRVTWKDGTMWPTWTGPAPGQDGDAPVVAKMIGVIGEGDRALPVLALFNTSSKEVSFINYSLAFLDANGKKLGLGGQGYGGPPGWLPAGKGGACVGSTVTPEGTVDVELKLRAVMFDDETQWRTEKK